MNNYLLKIPSEKCGPSDSVKDDWTAEIAWFWWATILWSHDYRPSDLHHPLLVKPRVLLRLAECFEQSQTLIFINEIVGCALITCVDIWPGGPEFTQSTPFDQGDLIWCILSHHVTCKEGKGTLSHTEKKKEEFRVYKVEGSLALASPAWAKYAPPYLLGPTNPWAHQMPAQSPSCHVGSWVCPHGAATSARRASLASRVPRD